MKQFLQKFNLTKKQLGIILFFLVILSVFISGFIFLPLPILILIISVIHMLQ